jgi:VanZ family protein
MAVIFIGSTDVLSHRQTSRFIGPLLRWCLPDISDEAITVVQAAIRKLGHLAEYAILAILAWAALRKQASCSSRYWSQRHAWIAWLIASLYAVTDELHQTFERSRQGSPLDVAIDAGGALAGLSLVWCLTRFWQYRRIRRQQRQPAPTPAARATI